MTPQIAEKLAQANIKAQMYSIANDLRCLAKMVDQESPEGRMYLRLARWIEARREERGNGGK